MPSGLYIDGYDTGQLGFRLERPPGREAPVSRDYPSAIVPGRPGAIFLARAGQGQPRRITCTGWIGAADRATLLANRDELLRRMGSGEHEISFDDDLTRYYLGRLENGDALSYDPATKARHMVFSPVFLCLDPLAYETTEQQVDFPAAAQPAPLGTGLVFPVLTITGPVLNPTIRYRDSAGNIVGELSLFYDIGAGETVTIDCRDQIIEHDDGAGTITNIADALVDDTDFIRLDPADYDGVTPVTLEIDPAGAATVARATYRRAWE